MKNKYFYVPFSYFIRTRIENKAKLFSWFCIYILPTFYLFITFGFHSGQTTLVITYLISVIIVYNNYEMGYLQNDCETTKKEIAPTMRLDDIQLAYYEFYKRKIYLLRIFITFVLLFFLYLFKIYSLGYLSFLFGSMLISLIYLIYNQVRSRLTLFFHFLLVSLRYFSPLLLLISFIEIDLLGLLGLLFLFPILNLMERAGTKRFGLVLFQKITSSSYRLALFRTMYYACLFILFLFFQLVYPLIFVAGYFFVYRLFIFILLSNQKKSSAIV